MLIGLSLWLIGALFTFIILIAIDVIKNTNNLIIKLLLTILCWPIILILYLMDYFPDD